MQKEDSQIIIRRFFEAVQKLKGHRIIRGKATLCKRYDINPWNFNTEEKYPERDMFQVAWLNYIVRDYKVSPEWLLTGKGAFFAPGWDAQKVKSVQNQCNKKPKQIQNSDLHI